MKIKIITTIFALLMPAMLFSQEPLKHEKKIYISPDGKIFINKDLPAYIWLSTSSDPNAPKYLLKSESTKKYTNPMYFDTEGRNTIRSPWAVDTVTKMPVYPKLDIVFEVYTDSRPPVSRVDFGKNYIYKKDNKSFCKQNVNLNFITFDEMSGVEALFYSINGSPYTKFTQPVELKEPKEYSIKYYAVDNVGNVEHVKNITIVIDAANPKSTLNFKGDYYENIFSSRASIEIKASDDLGIKNIFYQLDSNHVLPYTLPIKMSFLKQGEHTLKYYSIDLVENQENENSYGFYIDKTPPTIVEELIGNSFMANGVEYSSGRTKFKITAFDNKAGVKAIYYSLNRKEYQLYDKPFYLDASSGHLNIITYALDNVNNKSTDSSQSNNHKAKIPYIDLSGPSLNYTFIV